MAGQSGTSSKSEQEIKALLCHKWYPDSLQIGEEKVSAKFAGIEGEFIHFHKNGTFSDAAKHPAGYVSQEKWSYNHKARTISTEGGVKKVEVISEKKLVFSANQDGQKVRMFLKRIE